MCTFGLAAEGRTGEVFIFRAGAEGRAREVRKKKGKNRFKKRCPLFFEGGVRQVCTFSLAAKGRTREVFIVRAAAEGAHAGGA